MTTVLAITVTCLALTVAVHFFGAWRERCHQRKMARFRANVAELRKELVK